VLAHCIPVFGSVLALAPLKNLIPPTILAWDDDLASLTLDPGRGTQPMDTDLEQLKQRLPLLEYLQRHNWSGRRAGTQQEFVGLCPLHRETHPSFYVNAGRNLFYCHGCARGGDLIRFVEFFHDLSFHQSVAYLKQELASVANAASASELLAQAAAFYQLELHRRPAAVHYLERRGLYDSVLIEELGIGYAHGGNLRRHLTALGYSLDQLLDTGLINQQGRDAFCRRVIFPCCENGRTVNLYGRSIGAAFPHRLLPRTKGGLFAWESVRNFSSIILVEGLFDLGALWQAGFRNTTCALGTHLTSVQIAQLCEPPARCIYIAFDDDDNQAGQHTAHQLAQRLEIVDLNVRVVHLPHGQDPNSYFTAGATAADFSDCLERAQPL
jgi:DNA primase